MSRIRQVKKVCEDRTKKIEKEDLEKLEIDVTKILDRKEETWRKSVQLAQDKKK